MSKQIPWPDGVRCAAAITFDVDADSILHLEHPNSAHRRVGTQSWLRYDEVAVPAIVDMYARLGLRQTFFVPGWCIERYPRMVEQILAAGHELGAHGYLHELAHTLEPEREHELMRRAIDAVEATSGRRPRGWRGPLYSFSDRTAELLAIEGFTYHSGLMAHHLPYLLRTPRGDLVELPCDWANDDWPQYVVSLDFDWLVGVRPPERAFESFIAEFETAYATGGLWIGIWHPFVSGRPSRLARIERFAEELLARGDVWVAPLEDIAQHIAHLASAETWASHVVELPYDERPLG